jgi:large subunit ribosomal protein L21
MTEDESKEAPEAGEIEAEAEKKPTRSRARKAAAPKSSTGYAIVETGGKQYRVKVGDRIRVERLAGDAGSEIVLGRVLLLGGDGATTIGAPLVDGASVTAQVEAHPRGEKIDVYKYKAKKRYRRKIGHRQELTELTITGITA